MTRSDAGQGRGRSEAPRRFRFGDFELDESLFELRRAGILVPLEPRVFDLIAYLIRHRERIVSKDEILGTLWGDRALGETSVARCISPARKALRDSFDAPSLIRTVRGRGYQFIAAVEEEGPAEREAAGAPHPSTGVPLELGFVGRAPEIAAFDAACELARKGRGRLLFLCGEAGIGKTRAAEELATRARQGGFQVTVGRCSEHDGAPAYWPWVQILREQIDLHGEAAFLDLLGPDGPDVLQIAPDLAGRFADLPALPALESNEARFRCHDGFTRFCARSSSKRPMLLVLDDLHRADLPSLQLLHFLSAALTDQPILLLGTYREHELLAAPDHSEIGRRILRGAGATVMQLRGLGADSVSACIEEQTGLRPSDDLAERVRSYTGGNPFFLSQVIPLLAAPAGEAPSLSAGSLPESLRDAIQLQLDGLAPPCKRLLSVAATVGRDFDARILARAAQLELSRTLELLDSAVSARLLVRVEATTLRYRFVHILIRDVLEASRSSRERAALHARVGHAIETLFSAEIHEHLSELAHHFAEAGALDDSRRAIEYGCRAAERASGQLAYESAIQHYQRVLDLVPRDPETSAVDRAELLLAMALDQLRAGQRADADRTCERAAELARRAGDRALFARIALAKSPGFLSYEVGVFDADLVALLEEALEGLGDEHSELRAKLLGRLTLAIYWSDSHERRQQLSAQTQEIAERIRTLETETCALSARHAALWGPGHFEERLEIANELIALGERSGDRELALTYRSLRIVSLMELGLVSELDREIAAFSENAERLRQPQSLWYSTMYRSMRMLMQGRYGEARELTQSFLRVGQEIGDINVLQTYAMQLSFILVGEGEIETAIGAADSGAERFHRVLTWRAGVAWGHALAGDVERAREHFEPLAAREFSAFSKDMLWTTSMAFLAETCALLGDRPRAAILHEMLLPYANTYIAVGYGVHYMGAMARYVGQLAATLGRRDEACTLLEKAIEMERRVEATPWCALAHLELARLFDAHGENARARAASESGLKLARRVGMKRVIADLEEIRVRAEAAIPSSTREPARREPAATADAEPERA